MNIKDIPNAVGMYAVVGAIIITSPVVMAAQQVVKLQDKAADYFVNGYPTKK